MTNRTFSRIALISCAALLFLAADTFGVLRGGGGSRGGGRGASRGGSHRRSASRGGRGSIRYAGRSSSRLSSSRSVRRSGRPTSRRRPTNHGSTRFGGTVGAFRSPVRTIVRSGRRSGRRTVVRVPGLGVGRVVRGPGRRKVARRRRIGHPGSRRPSARPINTLPGTYRPIHYGGHDYYHYGHSWYAPRWYGGSFVYYSVYPPGGYFYTSLPPAYTTTMIDDVIYYEASGTFYTKGQKDGKDGYVTTEPPQQEAEAKPVAPEEAQYDPFKMLKESCDYLANRKQFRFVAQTDVDEMLESGIMLQRSGTRTVAVSRPDKLAVSYKGLADKRSALYDGKTLTLVSHTKNTYVQVPMPNTIDAAIDTLAVKYGMTMPLGDLLAANSYEALVAKVQTGQFISRAVVDWVTCYHLAFTQESVDWEIWIQIGDTPVPRRMVITNKKADGSPKYRVQMDSWDFKDIPADTFKLEIPKDAVKVRVEQTAVKGG